MIKPCGFMVLVKPDDVETKTESGIILTLDESKEAMAQVYGTLVAVGPSAWRAFDDGTPWAKVGDKVVYSKYGGKILLDKENGVKYTMLRDEDVLAVITKEEVTDE